MITIVTINRNNADGLERTIRSVIEQEERSTFEYVVIDGASTDRSTEVIAQYQDRLDFALSEPDKGIFNAMNKSLQYVHGDYVLFINSGDTLSRPDVMRQLNALRLSTDFVFGCWRRTAGDVVRSTQRPLPFITLYDLHYRSECVCHQATLTRTSLLRSLGGYDEAYRLSADTCLLMTALVCHAATQRTVDVVISDFDISGVSTQGEGALREEHERYFATTFAALAPDYARLRSFMRFSPTNLKRHLLWLIRRNNY